MASGVVSREAEVLKGAVRLYRGNVGLSRRDLPIFSPITVVQDSSNLSVTLFPARDNDASGSIAHFYHIVFFAARFTTSGGPLERDDYSSGPRRLAAPPRPGAHKGAEQAAE